MSISVKAANWEDFPRVLSLRRQEAAEGLSVDERVNPFDFAAAEFDRSLETASWCKDRDTMVLLALDGSDEAGFLAIDTCTLVGRGREPTARVNGFYVPAIYRERGVAGMLMRHALKVAKAAGIVWSQALVLERNYRMRRMLESRGYEQVGLIYQKRVSDG